MAEESEAIDSIGAVGGADTAQTYDNAPATATSVATQPSRQPSAREIQDAVAQLNQHLSSANRVLELNVDAGSGLTVATIRDSQTGAVLQQFPSSDSLHLAQMLAAWSAGKHMLLDLIA